MQQSYVYGRKVRLIQIHAKARLNVHDLCMTSQSRCGAAPLQITKHLLHSSAACVFATFLDSAAAEPLRVIL